MHYYFFVLTNVYECFFFFSGTQNFYLPVAGLFSRSWPRGTQGGRLYHDDASVGPGRAPWRVLWAFKVAKTGK